MVTNAVRLCGALHSAAVRLEGGLLHLVAHHNWSPEGLATAHRLFPMSLTRDHVTAHAVREARTIHLHHMHDDPTVPASSRELAIAQGYQTLLVVPMRRDRQAIGAIIVAKVEGPFSESQVALLQTFADQAVIAIENVRLFTQLEARNSDLTETLEQQTATGEILRVISSSPTDARPVFDTIAASAHRLCAAELCQVFRLEAGALHFVASEGHSPEGLAAARRAFPRPADRGTAAGRAVLSAAVVQIPDVTVEADYAVTAVAEAMNFRALVAVPMMREGRAVGAIVVARAEPGAFPDRQVELLQTFADQAVIAIENVRLFTELDARNHDLTNALEQQTATADVLSVMSASATDARPVFDAIVRNAVRLCHARFALVYQLAGDVIRFVTHHNLPPAAVDQFQRTFPQRLSESGTLVARAILRREVINVADIAAEASVSDSVRELAASAGYRSVLAVPIMREGRALGSPRDHPQRPRRRARAVLERRDPAPADLHRAGRHRDRERAPLQRAGGAHRAAHAVGRRAPGARRGQPGGQLHPRPGRGARDHRRPRGAAVRQRPGRGVRVRRAHPDVPPAGHPSDDRRSTSRRCGPRPSGSARGRSVGPG